MRYLFWGLVFFWWAMDLYLLVFKRNHEQKVAEKKSNFIVALLIFTGLLLALIPESFRATWRHRAFGMAQIAGTFILLAGLAIRLLSVLTLGKHFTRDLGVHKEKALVTSGLYGRIRHPSYTGEIIAFLGGRGRILAFAGFLIHHSVAGGRLHLPGRGRRENAAGRIWTGISGIPKKTRMFIYSLFQKVLKNPGSGNK